MGYVVSIGDGVTASARGLAWPRRKLATLVGKCLSADPRNLGRSEFTYIDVSAVSNTDLAIVAPQTVETANAPSRARQLTRAGDVLFATVRPGLRRVAVVPPELDGAIASTGYCVLRPESDALDPGYLFFACAAPTFVERIVAKQQGSSYPAVRDTDILEEFIAVPPIAEQRSIAKTLFSITKLRRTICLERDALTVLRAALVSELFRSDWPTVRLGDQITLQRGHDLPTRLREKGDVPVISSSGVTGFHSEGRAEGPGVVIGRYGTLGQVHFVEGPYWPLNTTLYVTDFHGNSPRFVGYFLETLEYEAHNDKTSVPGVNRNDLHALRVHWPEAGIQDSIVVQLEAVDRMSAALSRMVTASDELLAAASRSLFGAHE